jgi:1,4-dihydroxy-2-naphthoyl-CoA hydrolase
MVKIEPGLEKQAEFILDQNARHMGITLGIEFTELSRKLVVARMPVDENTKQPMGLLHGGASVALGETICSIGAWLNITEETHTAVGLEINANHIRPVRNGFVNGKASPIHIGKQTQVWQFEIETETGKKVCAGRCTLAIVKKRVDA